MTLFIDKWHISLLSRLPLYTASKKAAFFSATEIWKDKKKYCIFRYIDFKKNQHNSPHFEIKATYK